MRLTKRSRPLVLNDAEKIRDVKKAEGLAIS